MNEIIQRVKELFFSYKNQEVFNIEKLPQSGGDRIYFRISYGEGKFNATAIATFSPNIKENKFFLYCTEHFSKKHLCVPVIYIVSKDYTIYIQEDLGDASLLSTLQMHGKTKAVYGLYEKSLKALTDLQVLGSQEFKFDDCLVSNEFNKQQILNDLNYFKFYFLDLLKLDYNKVALAREFNLITDLLADAPYRFFMFRDFQGRNIMVKDGDVKFIDYQGGMKGPIAYDVASLLWQAKAELPDDWKNDLLNYYFDCIKAYLPDIDKSEFTHSYNNFTFLRLLQVLGAYGFRGLIEKKKHFVDSIPLALANLKLFQNKILPGFNVPELRNLINKITAEKMLEMFIPPDINNTSLVININSFSFITRGYPDDKTVNGGGFVFDCRGILNPGRIDKYKNLTGRDEDVIKYIHEETKMDEWLTSVFAVVDLTIENYLERNFSNLSISFGCTGGRHRSVFAADALNKHIKKKFGVKTIIKHLEQEFED